MKKVIIFLVMASLSVTSFGQSGNFNENTYTLEHQGEDSNDLYIKTYKSNSDVSYSLKKVYADSAYSILLSKGFFKSNIPEGPFVIYSNGNIVLQGTYKNGKWDGERKTYRNTVLVEKAYYNEGIKTGTWEGYSTTGQLKRSITHDSSGNIVSDVKY